MGNILGALNFTTLTDMKRGDVCQEDLREDVLYGSHCVILWEAITVGDKLERWFRPRGYYVQNPRVWGKIKWKVK